MTVTRRRRQIKRNIFVKISDGLNSDGFQLKMIIFQGETGSIKYLDQTEVESIERGLVLTNKIE